MRERIQLSVVILTKNNEGTIENSLKSVFDWCDEIMVIDDLSTDQTVEICRKYTEKIFEKKMENEGRHRNWAYAQARNAWILSLDSDEIVTTELREEITGVLKNNPVENGFTIPRRNYIGEHWIKHGGLYPSPQLKLFQKSKFRFEEAKIHGRAFMDDPCGHLKSDIIHHTYRDIEDFIRKLNRQTSLEAIKWFNQNKPMRMGRFIWRSIDRFTRTYIVKKGYKDGFLGFVVAFFASMYQIISYLKYREIVLNKKSKKYINC